MSSGTYNNSADMSFPLKLHMMLEQVERYGKESMISWMPSGKAFKVHNREAFSSQILPTHPNPPKSSKIIQNHPKAAKPIQTQQNAQPITHGLPTPHHMFNGIMTRIEVGCCTSGTLGDKI